MRMEIRGLISPLPSTLGICSDWFTVVGFKIAETPQLGADSQIASKPMSELHGTMDVLRSCMHGKYIKTPHSGPLNIFNLKHYRFISFLEALY